MAHATGQGQTCGWHFRVIVFCRFSCRGCYLRVSFTQNVPEVLEHQEQQCLLELHSLVQIRLPGIHLPKHKPASLDHSPHSIIHSPKKQNMRTMFINKLTILVENKAAQAARHVLYSVRVM